ncbi:MAG TPA: UDP-N-acetylmuramoyl-L-alanyl-D-glutamate--2,6-diaminopimelate ligase [Steroidobacteraceae bacterium]|nr:UDP-N-acetylmuramoyl-L-alanyl-D-glutamate--2,6-diaminopimelate ligase [Steroidobacteraceae bacterium]HQZ80528.1 UDP-N-acetylmuramoyl-L-alanyl-D-glutamate--2,6-diaminopimelate ligase [Steroidobacteraceae bacterium]
MTRTDDSPPRRLAELLTDAPGVPAHLEVTDLTVASGEVRPGGAFLACAGRTTHGLAHASEAIERGARAILWEPVPGLHLPEFPSRIFALPVPRLRAQLGAIADRFFHAPSAALTLVGVTGTNGKTTTAWLTAQALAACGRRASYSGTLGYGIPGDLHRTSHTTPDAISVHRQLAVLRAAGTDCVAMEVSSHALDQGRVTGVRFHTAVFTNLTRDHLDYHGTMTAYGSAKATLFDWPTLAARVINIDDPFGAELAQRHRGATAHLATVSRRSPASVRATATRAAPRGLELDVESKWGAGTLATRLVGDFNADNALAVLAVLLACDIPLAAALRALGACAAPPGRMESFGGEQGAPLAIVDYAHTPDALEKALAAARAHCSGRLSVVFGCGGDRDPGKRPIMGAIASRRADRIWITDDNPRTEPAALITAAIADGVAPGHDFHVEHDRTTAICSALNEARAGDAVLIAGKGHEDYQIVGHERRPFSDQAIVRTALGSRAAPGNRA